MVASSPEAASVARRGPDGERDPAVPSRAGVAARIGLAAVRRIVEIARRPSPVRPRKSRDAWPHIARREPAVRGSRLAAQRPGATTPVLNFSLKEGLMQGRIGIAVGALVLLAATAASAAVVTGTVQEVDEGAGIIVLEEGRIVRLTEDTRVLVDNRSLPLSAVVPGTQVVVVTPDRAGPPGVSREPAPLGIPGGWREAESSGRGLRPGGIYLDEMIQAP
jgi:hypothetical protein